MKSFLKRISKDMIYENAKYRVMNFHFLCPKLAHNSLSILSNNSNPRFLSPLAARISNRVLVSGMRKVLISNIA